MTTPYAGDGVGLLFPQDESYRLMYSPGGDREIPVIGPAYFGQGDEVPFRYSVKDFRLQLPNAVIYVKEDGTIIIEQTDDASTVPDGSNPSVKIDHEGQIYIDSTAQINIGDNASIIQIGGAGAMTLAQAEHIHQVGNMGMPVATPTMNVTTKTKGA